MRSRAGRVFIGLTVLLKQGNYIGAAMRLGGSEAAMSKVAMGEVAMSHRLAELDRACACKPITLNINAYEACLASGNDTFDPLR
jgi:hypothetical protein